MYDPFRVEVTVVLLARARLWAAAALVALVLPGGVGVAQSTPGPSDWQPGPEAGSAGTFAGFIDSPAEGALLPIDKPLTVNGWVVDTSTGPSGIDAVHVYAGKAGEGGNLLNMGSLSQPRPDVASALGNADWVASGFRAQVPAGLLQAGPVALTVYAHSPINGWWFKPVNVTMLRPRVSQPVLEVESPNPGDKLKFNNNYRIGGIALDPGVRPGEGSGVDLVQVYIFGERGSAAAQLVGVADVGDQDENALTRFGPQFALAGWGLTFSPSRFKIGNTTLFVYGRSTVTAAETLVTVDINIVER